MITFVSSFRSYLLLCLILPLASGCVLLPSPPIPTPTSTPLPSPTPWPTPTPYPTPLPTLTLEPPDTGWQLLQPGVELRQVRVEADAPSASPETGAAERLVIVRLDPTAVRFRVHYDPAEPRLVSDWAEILQPLLVVNGGYFTPENETVGLLISDGRVWGIPYDDFAGMFAVSPHPGPPPQGEGGERVSVRWLDDRPYDPAEPLTQALMSFPVLVKPGGVMGFPADGDDGRPARRTVVAQDLQGRILFIVAPRGTLSLHEMAVFLAESDLDLDVALNLDGGFSTGLWLNVGERSVEVASRVEVPVVIEVDFY